MKPCWGSSPALVGGDVVVCRQLASVRRHRSALRVCLGPPGGWIGFHAAAPCSLLNDCHPRPVNASPRTASIEDRRDRPFFRRFRVGCGAGRVSPLRGRSTAGGRRAGSVHGIHTPLRLRSVGHTRSGSEPARGPVPRKGRSNHVGRNDRGIGHAAVSPGAGPRPGDRRSRGEFHAIYGPLIFRYLCGLGLRGGGRRGPEAGGIRAAAGDTADVPARPAAGAIPHLPVAAYPQRDSRSGAAAEGPRPGGRSGYSGSGEADESASREHEATWIAPASPADAGGRPTAGAGLGVVDSLGIRRGVDWCIAGRPPRSPVGSGSRPTRVYVKNASRVLKDVRHTLRPRSRAPCDVVGVDLP